MTHWDTVGPALLAWLGVIALVWRVGMKIVRAVRELAEAARGNTRALAGVRSEVRDLHVAVDDLRSSVKLLKSTTESHGRQLAAIGGGMPGPQRRGGQRP